MTVVSLCSAKGSPGVSTLALALGSQWPRERTVAVVELDPSGGDFAARFGLLASLGTASLLACHRDSVRDGDVLEIESHLQRLPGGLEVIAGPVGAGAARAVDAGMAALVPALRSTRDLVFDLGRLVAGAGGQRAALGCSDHVFLVVSNDAAEVANARPWARWLGSAIATVQDATRQDATLGLVVRGDQSDAREISDYLEIGSYQSAPDDHRSARAINGLPPRRGRLGRRPLLRVARSIAWSSSAMPRARSTPGDHR